MILLYNILYLPYTELLQFNYIIIIIYYFEQKGNELAIPFTIECFE